MREGDRERFSLQQCCNEYRKMLKNRQGKPPGFVKISCKRSLSIYCRVCTLQKATTTPQQTVGIQENMTAASTVVDKTV